jgi:serine/threonine protein kinase
MDDKAMFSEGQAIGPYKIVRCIGCGGMGEVYEVEHESLGVHYALKTFAYRGSAHRAFARWLAGVTLRLPCYGSGEP